MPLNQRKGWMRNKPCPCGSGKKFKRCCWSKFSESDKKLMKLFLDCPRLVRSIVITDNQISLIKLIREDPRGYMSASDLSEKKDITVQSASIQLAKLWKTGYLKRTERVAETGGIEFIYESVVE